MDNFDGGRGDVTGTPAEMIREKRARGTALLGIFHDAEVRGAVADRVVDAGLFSAAAAAAV